MASGKVTVLAIFTAKAGFEKKLSQEAQALLEPTRQEEGCINYNLHQDSGDPARLMFHENWRSQQDLDEHLQKPYLTRFLALTEELLAEPVQLTLWHEIG